MPLPFSLAGKIEKNKLSNDKPWLILLQLDLPDGTAVNIVRNNEDIPWNGIDWIAFPFDMSDKTEDMKSLPVLNIQVSNVAGIMQSYLEEYDGLTDCLVTIRLIHFAHLDNLIPEMEETFSIQETDYDDEWVKFSLGADFWFFYRALAGRYLKDWCDHKYGGIKCGVNNTCLGKYTSCSHTLLSCRDRMKASGITKIRFGGEPALPGGIYASNS